MTMWYSVEGKMKFNKEDLDRPEVKALFDEEEFCLIQHSVLLQDGTTAILLGFNDSIPNQSETEIDELILNAGAFAAEPGYFKFVKDDNRGKVWFGKEEDIPLAKRKENLKKVKKLLKDLSKDELVEIFDSLGA